MLYLDCQAVYADPYLPLDYWGMDYSSAHECWRFYFVYRGSEKIDGFYPSASFFIGDSFYDMSLEKYIDSTGFKGYFCCFLRDYSDKAVRPEVPVVENAGLYTLAEKGLLPFLNSLDLQLNVKKVVAVLAFVIVLPIGLVFAYWGIRKGIRSIMAAFRGGRASAG